MSLLRREPVLLAVAAVVIVLGVDIHQLTETVNRLLELVAVVGAGVAARAHAEPFDRKAAKAARQKVTPL